VIKRASHVKPRASWVFTPGWAVGRGRSLAEMLQQQIHLEHTPGYGNTTPSKPSQDSSSLMTCKPNTQNTAPLNRLSGQPALKVRLAASTELDGNEWAWVVEFSQTAAAVWAERTCEVAGGAAQNSHAVPKSRFFAFECKTYAALAKVQPAQSPLRMSSAFSNAGGALQFASSPHRPRPPPAGRRENRGWPCSAPGRPIRGGRGD